MKRGQTHSHRTLPDWIDDDLELLSIGINPSLASVERGFPFARPQNRFWRALNESGLVPERLEPGVEAMDRLLRVHRIGFTDVVKRPTANAADLRLADWRRGVPELHAKIQKHRPRIAWFQGAQAWRSYLRYAVDAAVAREPLAWGLQRKRIGHSLVFVTPNPSPANAAHSLADLIGWYRRLAVVEGV